jgi:hypothetical protein
MGLHEKKHEKKNRGAQFSEVNRIKATSSSRNRLEPKRTRKPMIRETNPAFLNFNITTQISPK